MSQQIKIRDFRDSDHLFKRYIKERLDSTPRNDDEEAWQRRIRANQEKLVGFIADIQGLGIVLDEASDLLRHIGEFNDAYPLLLRHLTKDYPANIRDIIARSFCTTDAYPYFDELSKIYREVSARDPKDWGLQGLGVSVSYCSKDKRLRELLELADIENEYGRTHIVSHLKRYWRRPEVWEWLNRHGEDPSLAGLLVPWIHQKREQISKALVDGRSLIRK